MSSTTFLFSTRTIVIPKKIDFVNILIKHNLIDCFHAFIGMLHNISAPETQHCPFLEAESLFILYVPLHIPDDLLYPVRAITPVLQPELQLIPVFSMEELAVTENSNAVLCNGNIWASGKSSIILSVSVPMMPQGLSQLDLYRSILGTDCSHVLMPLFWRHPAHPIPPFRS